MQRFSQWGQVTLALVAAIVLPIPSAMGQSLTKAQVQSQIDAAKNARTAAQTRIATLKTHIGQLNTQAANLNTQLSTIEAEVSRTQAAIDQTVLAIQARNQQIQSTQAQITSTKAKLTVQYQILTNRLRVMYEAGHTNYLAVLFSASSFSDFLGRFHMLTLVAQQDRVMFDSVKRSELDLEHQQAELKVKMHQQQTAYAVLFQKQQVQSQQQASERRLLGQVQDQTAIETADMNNEQNALSDLGSKLKELQKELGSFTPAPSSTPQGPWAWPVPGYTSVSSGYGWRTLFGSPNFHPGIDIPAPIGTPIVAATGGRVLFAGPADGYGNWIVIDSGNGLMEIYGHMYSNELEVSPGQIVQRGQEIARVGNNGESTGPHLHFEVATGIGANGIPISTDPTKYVG